MAYQKPSVPPVDGAVNVCAIELSPFVAPVVPSSAACVPPCAPLATTDVDPAVVQPLRSPVSKSPLVIGLAGVVEVTMSCGDCGVRPALPDARHGERVRAGRDRGARGDGHRRADPVDTVVGLKVTVTPGGSCDVTDRLTVCGSPATTSTVALPTVEPPCGTSMA